MKKPKEPSRQSPKQRKGETSQMPPNAATQHLAQKARVARIAEADQRMIVFLRMCGKSVRKIAEETNRDRETVNNVLSTSEELRKHNEEAALRLMKSIPDFVTAVMVGAKIDYQFAAKILTQLGTLPSPELIGRSQASAVKVVTEAPAQIPSASTALGPKVREVPGDTVELYGSRISKTYLPFFARFFEVMDIGDKENGLEPPEYLPGKGLPEVVVENGKIVDIRPPKITPAPEDEDQTS